MTSHTFRVISASTCFTSSLDFLADDAVEDEGAELALADAPPPR
jgi:hypothetical protein